MFYKTRDKFKQSVKTIVSVNNIDFVNGFGGVIVFESGINLDSDVIFVSRKPQPEKDQEIKNSTYYEFK